MAYLKKIFCSTINIAGAFRCSIGDSFFKDIRVESTASQSIYDMGFTASLISARARGRRTTVTNSDTGMYNDLSAALKNSEGGLFLQWLFEGTCRGVVVATRNIFCQACGGINGIVDLALSAV